MRIRPLTLAEVDAFAALTPGDAGEIRREAAFLLDRGETRDGWWFIGEERGGAVARAAFWAQRSAPREAHLYRPVVPWEEDFPDAGARFLRECLLRLRARGIEMVEARAYHDSEGGPDRVEAVLAATGFDLVQRKLPFTRSEPSPLAEPDRGLRFRTLAEASEAEYVDAIRRVGSGTLDRGTRAEVARLGPAEAARAFYRSLRDIHFDPGWWLLADTAGGALAGLVVPQRLEEGLGAINYIGVVPECRGRRFGAALLARGCNILVSAGLGRILADVDSENAPLDAALPAAGFVRGHPFSVFLADLAALR